MFPPIKRGAYCLIKCINHLRTISGQRDGSNIFGITCQVLEREITELSKIYYYSMIISTI